MIRATEGVYLCINVFVFHFKMNICYLITFSLLLQMLHFTPTLAVHIQWRFLFDAMRNRWNNVWHLFIHWNDKECTVINTFMHWLSWKWLRNDKNIPTLSNPWFFSFGNAHIQLKCNVVSRSIKIQQFSSISQTVDIVSSFASTNIYLRMPKIIKVGV